MNPSARRVAIIGGSRIPFARANTVYGEASNQDMLTAAFRSLVSKYSLENERLGEVAAGAVIKHSRDWNLARESMLGSGLHPETPAYDLQRACGTSLSTAVQIAHRIALGEIECGIACGVDTSSDIPLSYGRQLQQSVLGLSRAKTLGESSRPSATCGRATSRPRQGTPSAPGLSMGRTARRWEEWYDRRVERTS